MLEELIIKDYALIDTLSVQFDGGLNILTGETGAGKSIIVGALSFLLGSKAETDIVRTGCEEALVSAVVGIDKRNSEALEWLASREMNIEDACIVLRRTLKKTGRGGAYINDLPVSRTDLAEFTATLFDIHGQHEHQTLLKKESHRKYLDRFAGIEEEVSEFTSLFRSLSDARKAFESSLAAERGRDEKLELLQYSVEEIDKAAPKSGETVDLEAEAKRLGDFEKLAQAVNAASSLFTDDDESVMTLLRRIKSFIDNAVLIDTELSTIAKRLTDAFYETEDIGTQLRSYKDDLSYDPDRLEQVEERLAILYRLKKKYGTDEDAILLHKEQILQEIDNLQRMEEDRNNLEAEIESLEKEIAKKADSISVKRGSAALELGSKISEILASLGMSKARFEISVQVKGKDAQNKVCGPYGADDIEFLISPNLGEPLKELSKIASGGELSRVMLAIKTVLAHADTIETLVFDEIDTGIGGEVALAVGKHLLEIGKLKQIFCITHLASIAVRADNHLKVAKIVEGGRTLTTVSVLKSEVRREEIARMLAGDSAGNAALAHADELLETYSKRG